MRTVYPLGTTIYDPDKCQSGYTLLSFYYEDGILVIDMNGNVVHRWDRRVLREPKLLKNGNLLVSEITADEGRTPAIRRTRIREFNWDAKLI